MSITASVSSRSVQAEQAAAFRRMHERGSGILVLPNAWDAMSARIIEDAGARAIATTSSGVSWSLGRPDGQGLSRDEMIAAVRRISGVVRVPVTADIEGGYGERTTHDVAATVRAVIAAGAVGINLEDSPGTDGKVLLDPALQAERIEAARSAADSERIAVFINARIDTYLRRVGDGDTDRFEQTVHRAAAYIASGADGVFVPGLIDAQTIGRLVGAIDAPLNIMAQPGAPAVAELAALGVARVSTGGGIAEAMMAFVRRAAGELLQHGSYEALEQAIPFAEANRMFAGRG